jgi:hypothetical protein
MSLAYLRNVNTKDNSALNKQDIENIHTEIIFLVFNTRERLSSLQNNNKTTNSVALVRKQTIPTERPPLVGEVSANFSG